MKRFYSLSTLVASVLFSSSAIAGASQVTVSYNGIDYTIGSQNTNYTANPTFFTSQPWWGNAGLATQLTGLVQGQLGFTLFGYGVSNH